MNRFAHDFFAVLLLAISIGPALAQEATLPAEPGRVPAELERRYEQMKKELAKELPQREFKVAVAAPVKERLFRADVKLFENKFVAYFVLRPPGVDLQDASSIQAHTVRLQNFYRSGISLPEKLRVLRIDNHSLYDPPARQDRRSIGASRGGSSSEMPVHFKALAELCPADLRPDERAVDFLTSAACTRDMLHYGQVVGQDALGISVTDLVYRIFAPTAADAEARAKAIVRLYDGGFSRPMQTFLVAEMQRVLDEARGQYAQLAPLPAAIKAELEKANKPTEISDDILTQLKAQKVLIAVELAGLNARVQACDKMLQESDKLPQGTLQSIGDMKVKAEVERVGIKEKLDQINKFIAEGAARQTAAGQYTRLTGTQIQLRSDIRRNENIASSCAEAFTLCAPFEVVDNQISVGPVEWTE